MELPLSETAKANVANTSKTQVWAFVCSDRSKGAIVTEAHISYETAKRHARMINGCMRVGRVVDGKAVTM